jgi:hypothetical protein
MPEPKLPGPFDGRPIVKVTTALRGAGDGLSKAMATDAMRIHHGERLTALVDVVCLGTHIKPLDNEDPSGPQQAVYQLVATGRATFVGPELAPDVAKLLDAQEQRNDEARGRPQLPMDTSQAPAALAEGDDPSVPSPALGAPPADDLPTDGDGYADPALAAPEPAKAKGRKRAPAPAPS